ncbi:MAG: GNAT family N-acetyltransferase [Thermomicrobiales bacterium]
MVGPPNASPGGASSPGHRATTAPELTPEEISPVGPAPAGERAQDRIVDSVAGEGWPAGPTPDRDNGRRRGAGPDGAAGPIPGHLEIGPVRFRELRAVGRLQRRAFSPRLAYGLGTLVLLWALPSVTFLVARRGGLVVGCGIGDIHVNQGRVINLATDPDARRQGVARALLRALEDAFPTGSVVLVVEEDNAPARALYASSGYAHHRHSRDYYGRGRHGVWMEKVRPRDTPGPKPRPPAIRF